MAYRKSPSSSGSTRSTVASSLAVVSSSTRNTTRTRFPGTSLCSVTTLTPPAERSTDRTTMRLVRPRSSSAAHETGSRTMTRKNSLRSGSITQSGSARPGRPLTAEAPGLLLAHERVAVVGRRHERLLDRARARPPDQVPHGAGLVVRPRRPRPAERLLADDRAGRLVVHVEVAGGVSQGVGRVLDRAPVGGEDRPRQRVRRRPVDQLERVVDLLLVVDVGGHDRAEQLPRHQVEARVAGLDHRRADEPALGVVAVTADDHLGP